MVAGMTYEYRRLTTDHRPPLFLLFGRRSSVVFVVMDDQRRGTVGAGGRVASCAAHYQRCRPAPVKGQNTWLAAADCAGARRLHRGAEDRPIALLKFLASIH